MTSGEVIAAVAVPLFIFVITAIYGGVKLLLKASSYMTRSATAQESSASAATDLNVTLKAYMVANDAKVNDHERRIFVLEDDRRQREQERSH